MGDITDMVLSTCDPFDEEWPGEYYGEPTLKTCKYCGQDGLRWGINENTGWRLYGPTAGVPHICQQYRDKE